MSHYFHEQSVAMLSKDSGADIVSHSLSEMLLSTLYLVSLLNSNLKMSQVVSDMCLCIFQCVPNSRNLPLATISVVKDHPEMTDWVHSKDDSAPFYISSNIYTKIVVDRVQAADQRTYNVLFLSTGTVKCMQFTTSFFRLQSVLSRLFRRALFTISADNSGLRIKLRSLPKRFLKQMCSVFEDTGKIHKVLEAGSKPFIISETQISSQSSIQSMNLHSKKVEKIFSSATCLENRALLSVALLPTSVPQRKCLFFTGLLQFFLNLNKLLHLIRTVGYYQRLWPIVYR